MALRHELTRRRFLRGVGLSGAAIQIGLPAFEALFNSGGTAYAATNGGAAQPIETRFIIWFNGNGIIEKYWIPRQDGDKYEITSGMLIAAIVVGYAKIWQGIATSSATAVCSRSDLGILNVVGWLGLGVALAACWLLKSQGLVGIIYGVGAGWAFYALAATVMTSRSLARRYTPNEL